MEKLERYRQIIQKIILDYAKIPYAHSELQKFPVFDCENDRYLLIVEGREEKKHLHYATIHVDIINGKFWIRQDGTENGIAADLLEAGISKDNIVLAFHSPEKRKYTDFAVA